MGVAPRTQSLVSGRPIALGLSGGLMALVREQDVLLVIGPGLDFLIHARQSMREPGGLRRTLAAATAGTVAFLGGITPQLLAYKALNGHFGQTTTAANKMSWTSPHGFSVLFDPEHGLFAWTPLALLAIAGLVLVMFRGPRPAEWHSKSPDPDVRRIAALALLMVAAQRTRRVSSNPGPSQDRSGSGGSLH